MQIARPHRRKLPTTREKEQNLEKKKVTELFKTLTGIKYLPCKDRMGSGKLFITSFDFSSHLLPLNFLYAISITKANEFNL